MPAVMNGSHERSDAQNGGYHSVPAVKWERVIDKNGRKNCFSESILCPINVGDRRF